MKRPTDREVRKLLDRLVIEIPRAATEIGYARRSCVLHTRVACDFLRERGVRARPLACRVLVANRPWRELMQELGRWPERHEWRDRGEWALGIGYGRDDDLPGYDGHVVTIVERRYMLDLTIDQADRPQHGIELEPFWTPVTRDFLSGGTPVAFWHDDSWVAYGAKADDRGFLTTPDWIMAPGAGRLSPLPLVRASLA